MTSKMKCQYCGKEESLPFKCPFCNGYFCAEHRLPENHTCTESWRTRAPREETPTIVVESKTPYEYEFTYAPFRPRVKPFHFSLTEIRHLTVSAVLVAVVGMSYIVSFRYRPEILASLAVVFSSVFLLHEIAHKLVAQHYGLWAEFRLTMFGALITLFSVISPIKIVSPGAVMIAGSVNKKTVGKTAMAGPLTNITLSIVSLALAFYLPLSFFKVAMFSAAFNAWIALFNLIPAGVLDGWKIFEWNKIVWGTGFILSVALTAFTFFYLY